MARRRRKNPGKFDEGKFRSEAMQLVRENPQDLVDVAATWKGRYHNAMMETKQAMEKGIELGASLGGAAATALIDAGGEAEFDFNLEQAAAAAGVDLASATEDELKTLEEAATEDGDPRTFLMLDKGLWVPAALGAGALFGLGGEYNGALASSAIGAGSYYVGSMVHKWRYESKKKALEEAPPEDA